MRDCCDNPNPLLITGGQGSGGRQSVTVCSNCGGFHVFADEDGHQFSINFKIWSNDVLMAASQGYWSVRTDKPVENKRVWKPLDFGHKRLYDVVLSYQEKGSERTRRIHYTVASTAPRYAAAWVREIYKETFDNKDRYLWWDVQGQAMNVLQPLDWTENGITLLNNEMLDAIENHLANCLGCRNDVQTEEGLVPCADCNMLEEFILARHNKRLEDDRPRQKAKISDIAQVVPCPQCGVYFGCSCTSWPGPATDVSC